MERRPKSQSVTPATPATPPPSPRAAEAVRHAAVFVLVIALALLVGVLVSWGVHGREVRIGVPSSAAAQYLRVAFVFSAVSMLGISASALGIGRAMPGNVGQIDSAVNCCVHSLAISSATLLIGIVGLGAEPILINPVDSRLVASLDVMLMPALRLYAQHVLLEVVHAQNTSPTVLGIRAFRGPDGAVPCTIAAPRPAALLVALNVLTCLGFVVARVLASRSAAGAVFAATLLTQVPAATGFALACRELFANKQFYIFTHFGAAIYLVGMLGQVLQVVVEALYDFTDVLPLGPVLPDAAFFFSLYMIALLSVSASIIVDRLGRADLAAVLRQQAGANQALAESREQLLRWLAHEARVPLNSLYMGLQVGWYSCRSVSCGQEPRAHASATPQLLNSREGSLRKTLPPQHEDVTTLGQCCSAAEALIGVLSDVLDVSKMDSQGVKVCGGE